MSVKCRPNCMPARVVALMSDGVARTVPEIATALKARDSNVNDALRRFEVAGDAHICGWTLSIQGKQKAIWMLAPGKSKRAPKGVRRVHWVKVKRTRRCGQVHKPLWVESFTPHRDEMVAAFFGDYCSAATTPTMR
jgi:hypothetical protein